jgi:hypothetical protein
MDSADEDRSPGLWAASSSDQGGIAWLASFLTPDMVAACFRIYERVRATLMDVASPRHVVQLVSSGLAGGTPNRQQLFRAIASSLGSINEMLISFAGVDASVVFPSKEQKCAFVNSLLSHALKLLDATTEGISFTRPNGSKVTRILDVALHSSPYPPTAVL